VQNTTLEFIEVNPASAANASVIWLHGLGADGHDFASIVPEMNLPDAKAIRFIFPHAPYRPVTLNQGYQMRAWFDIHGLQLTSKEDEQGIRQSELLIHDLIEHEQQRDIQPENIILAGFSQGAALAIHTGLRYPKRLGGIIALSAFLPLANSLATEVSNANQNIPIMMGHGTMDPMVSIKYGEMTRDYLQTHGYSVDWHVYPMQHQVCHEEIQDISHWLQKILK